MVVGEAVGDHIADDVVVFDTLPESKNCWNLCPCCMDNDIVHSVAGSY